MVEIVVTKRDGEQLTLDATSGFTLMESVRDDGDLQALCGGMCSCATCHVYVDDRFENILPPISEDEEQLLDGSEHRRESSRLSCQITLTEAMNGLRITIAPED